MKSIITKYDQYCIICSKPTVERHHFLGGTSKRKLADEDGVFAGLCPNHHNSSKMSVHQNKEMKVLSQQLGQLAWERYEAIKMISETIGVSVDKIDEEIRVSFRKRYGISYL